MGRSPNSPVIDDGRLVGLLTTETVTRWLANRLDAEDGIILEESVDEVMKYQETTRHHEILDRDATIFDALDAFDRFNSSGRSLDAIIITQSGKVTETPIGIVTVADIPEMHQKIKA